MKITRDVITDLLPVYYAGEASADTKQLVEEFLREDLEFSRLVQATSRLRFQLPPIQSAPHPESEALARTKRALRRRSWLMALAIFCTLAPFTFAFSNGTLIFFMWRDAPDVAAAFQTLGLSLWILYYLTHRRLRKTSL